MNPRVKMVVALAGHRLRLKFDNGEVGVYDCTPLLTFGVFRDLADIRYFRQAAAAYGTVVWPNGQDLCPDTLPGVVVDEHGCPLPIRADFDHDGDVDQTDYGHLQACISGTGSTQANPACADALFDNDSDVDRDDLTVFLGCLSGHGVPADPDCGP